MTLHVGNLADNKKHSADPSNQDVEQVKYTSNFAMLIYLLTLQEDPHLV
jgi:hypothetical protein